MDASVSLCSSFLLLAQGAQLCSAQGLQQSRKTGFLERVAEANRLMALEPVGKESRVSGFQAGELPKENREFRGPILGEQDCQRAAGV
jgi:hypothetical protein